MKDRMAASRRLRVRGELPRSIFDKPLVARFGREQSSSAGGAVLLKAGRTYVRRRQGVCPVSRRQAGTGEDSTHARHRVRPSRWQRCRPLGGRPRDPTEDRQSLERSSSSVDWVGRRHQQHAARRRAPCLRSPLARLQLSQGDRRVHAQRLDSRCETADEHRESEHQRRHRERSGVHGRHVEQQVVE